jgi:hypothetical protein
MLAKCYMKYVSWLDGYEWQQAQDKEITKHLKMYLA